MPTFSIIIPVYKVEKYIKDCIESVVNQTFDDFEALFVDDCGGDNSIKIVEEYAQKDRRIKVLYHEVNRGLSAARNTALDNATGKYIVCLDSDDWLEPNCLSVIYKEFQERQTNSIWFDSNKFYDDTKKFDEKTVAECKKGFLTITPANINNLTDYSWIKSYTTESIKKHELCWPEGLTFEDAEFYYKYFTLNPDIYICEDCLHNYRIREGSIVTNSDKGIYKIEDIYQIVKNLKDFYIKYNLYDEYKLSMLKLLRHRISVCTTKPNSYKRSLPLSKDLLEYLNFPKDFEQFNIPSKPLVTVVVSIHNAKNYIEQFIKSIQSQIYSNLEIIFVNKCVNKKSIKIIEKMVKNDNRIRIVDNDIDVTDINGEYVLFLDTETCLNSSCVMSIVKDFKTTGSNKIQVDCVKVFRKEFLINNPETHAASMF